MPSSHSSLSSSVSRLPGPTAPPVPPHRQDELRSAEEKQIWDMFDKAKHPAHSQRKPPASLHGTSPASYSTSSSHSAQSAGSGVRKLPSVFNSAAFQLEAREDRDRKKRKKEHPLLEERRNAKRLRVPTGVTTPSVPSPPAPTRFNNPPPPSAHRPSAASAGMPVSRTHRKTQLLVDPRVAAAEKAREERHQRLQTERLTAQRLKPSLDELHSTLLSWPPLQLEGSVRASLEQRFVRVPLTFADDLEYQTVFYPLLLEECRAELLAAMSETDMAQDERASERPSGKNEPSFNPRGLLEVVSVVSYEKVNAFHHIEVDRVDFDGTKRPSLFNNDDLVLLWYRPSAADPFEPNEWRTASLHALARLERVHDKREEVGQKAERRKPGVHYKLQVHVEQTSGAGEREDGAVDGKKLLQFLLRGGSQWGVVKVMTLVTIHRQYRALQSCHLLSLFPFLMRPASLSSREKVSPSNALRALQQFPSDLIRSFNPSQREAMATAMAATDGITLIQGPPGQSTVATTTGPNTGSNFSLLLAPWFLCRHRKNKDHRRPHQPTAAAVVGRRGPNSLAVLCRPFHLRIHLSRIVPSQSLSYPRAHSHLRALQRRHRRDSRPRAAAGGAARQRGQAAPPAHCARRSRQADGRQGRRAGAAQRSGHRRSVARQAGGGADGRQRQRKAEERSGRGRRCGDAGRLEGAAEGGGGGRL